MELPDMPLSWWSHLPHDTPLSAGAVLRRRWPSTPLLTRSPL